MVLFATLNINNTQHNIFSVIMMNIIMSHTFFYCYAECRYAECRYAECRYAECHGAREEAFTMRRFTWIASGVSVKQSPTFKKCGWDKPSSLFTPSVRTNFSTTFTCPNKVS